MPVVYSSAGTFIFAGISSTFSDASPLSPVGSQVSQRCCRRRTGRRFLISGTEFHSIPHHAHDLEHRRFHSQGACGHPREGGQVYGRHCVRAACRCTGPTALLARPPEIQLDVARYEVPDRDIRQGSSVHGTRRFLLRRRIRGGRRSSPLRLAVPSLSSGRATRGPGGTARHLPHSLTRTGEEESR